MMCRRAAVVVLVAGVLLPAAGGVAATKPVQVHCGQIIRADTKVANDLHDCPDIGLAIGASNITLDLNGHTIDGDGTFVEDCPEEEPCDSGITNSQLDGTEVVNGPGFPGVTIRNGTVRDFPGVGVYEFGVSGNRLIRVHVEGAGDGVIVTRSDTTAVDGASVSGFEFVGFVLSHDHDISVTHSSASNAAGFSGFLLNDVHDALLEGNRSADAPDADGVTLLNGAHDNTIRGNSVARNGGGIGVNDSADNVVKGNDIHDNLFIGIYTNNGDGNVFSGNRIAHNGDGSAGGLVLDANENGTSDGNVLTGNTLLGNVGDGILVLPGQTGTQINGNVADNNTGDGIRVQAAPATIAANVANHNGELGIEAGPGVTDGGKNHAAANGDPRQCVGVVCR